MTTPTTQFQTTWTPSPDQEVASKAIDKWWDTPNKDSRNIVFTVGGLAGTGKTRLSGQKAKEFMERGLHVAYATLTGKASKVLRDSLEASGVIPDFCGTLHSLMYTPSVDEHTGAILGWNRKNVLPYHLIFIDEASMVSQDILRDLLSYNIPILAVGDYGQLPPVGEDASLMANPHVKLDKIHRQAQGNPVIELAHMVRQDLPLETLVDFIKSQNDPRLRYARNGTADAIAMTEHDGLLITHTNRHRVELNALFRRINMGIRVDAGPVVGDKIICVKNFYFADRSLLANGMTGDVLSLDPPTGSVNKMDVDFGGPVPVTIYANTAQWGREKTFASFQEVPGNHRSWNTVGVLCDYGRALSCHKAQGAQAKNVAVFLQSSLKVLSREDKVRWMYTAFSRSSENLLICS